jgi:nucleotide-binding universal stress UspA family protein
VFKSVVLAVDLAEPTSWARALPVAIEICRNSAAKLYVVTVAADVNVQVASFFPEDANERLQQQSVTDLKRWIGEHVPSGIEVHQIVAQGPVHREIIAAAEKVNADLIVMASHKPTITDYVLGANAAHVVRHAGCSVMVVRGA